MKGTPLVDILVDFRDFNENATYDFVGLNSMGSAAMISDEKIFDFAAMRANQTSNDTDSGLKMFIPMYSAILAGSIWLTDKLENAVPMNYRYLADALVILLTLVCSYTVLDNLRAWWGYREQLCELTRDSGHPIPPPTWKSAIMEFVLCVGMICACLMYVWFNPLATHR